jgi:hypothetical protein
MYSRAGTAKSKMSLKSNKVGDILVDNYGKTIDGHVEDAFMDATSRKGAFKRKNSYNSSSYGSEDSSAFEENKYANDRTLNDSPSNIIKHLEDINADDLHNAIM